MRAATCLLLSLALGLAGCTTRQTATPLPLAHAHNDYLHARPLLDALDEGFCSVEADVHLVNGQLLVAHSLKDVKPDRTLVGLYLDPLRERVRANGGRVYRNGPGLTLLIDVKSEAASTYSALHDVLARYADMLTTYRDGAVSPGAVTAIISGNRAPAAMAAQGVRYAALDGRPPDLEVSPPVALIPLVSADWNRLFTWRWDGTMPAAERETLEQLIERTHAQGRRIRFWNTPDRPQVWGQLRSMGVDLINTDDLRGLRGFLLNESGPSAAPPADKTRNY